MDWHGKDKQRAKAVEDEIERLSDRIAAWRLAVEREPGTHPKERAAMLRASMDLTRALTDLRRHS